ncbi:MFS transporter [Nocardioides fonticola]
MTSTSQAPADPRTAGRALTAGTLLAAALAVAVAQIGVSMPAVLNGVIQRDLGTTSTELTWVSDAFLVPITLLELTFGVLGDLFGRKRLLIIGAALMTAGGVLTALTPGPDAAHGQRVAIMLGGQVVAGIGAAAIFPTSVALLAAATTTVKERSHALSVWAAALTGAGVVAPVASGLLVRLDHDGGPFASWRWPFLALAGLAAVSAVVTLLLSQDSRAREGRRLDPIGQILVSAGFFALLYGVIDTEEHGLRDAGVLLWLAAGAVLLTAFVLYERGREHPLLDISLFRNRVFATTAAVTVIGMFAYLGTAYATSIRVSAIQGYSPLKTAVAFVCLNIMGVVLFPVSSRLIERHSPGWILAGGMALISAGDVAMALIPATHVSIAAVAVPLLAIGAGFKLAVTAVTVVAVNSVPVGKAGMASGATSMLRDLGLTLGPAIIGAVSLSRAGDAIAARLASDPQLASAYQSFLASPASAPPEAKGELAAAVGAVQSGPLGANAVPAAINPLKDVAFHALSDAYATGYLICAVAAAVAAIIAAVMIGGRGPVTTFTEELPGELPDADRTAAG